MLDGGVTRPEDLPPALVDLRLEWINAGGHGALRHDFTRAGEAAQRDRCTLGHDPITGNRTDWETGNDHKYARDACAFATPAALVFAEAKLWASEQATAQRQGDEPKLAYRAKVDVRDVSRCRFTASIADTNELVPSQNTAGFRPVRFPEDTRIFAIYQRAAPGRPWYLYTIYPEADP